MKVGRIVEVITDKNRNELLVENEESRKILISMFYPAKDTGKQSYYHELYNGNLERFLSDWGENEKERRDLQSIKVKTEDNIEIVPCKDGYPIIIYSPGFSFDRDSSMFLIEELVLDGNIVITVGSTYETDYSIFPNGTTIDMHEELEFLATKETDLWKQVIDYRVEDIIYVTNYLETLNTHPIINGNLNVCSIGLLGFSVGSGSMFEVVERIPRIKCVQFLDAAFVFTSLEEKVNNQNSSSVPVLCLKRHASNYSEMKKELDSWYDNKETNEYQEALDEIKEIGHSYNRIKVFFIGEKHIYRVDNTSHMTFCDSPLLGFEESINCYAGSINTIKAHKTIRKATVAFFRSYLHLDNKRVGRLQNDFSQIEGITKITEMNFINCYEDERANK